MSKPIKRSTNAQEMISFRLPKRQLEMLDQHVESEGSSRTAIIRAALANYFRMTSGMFVPLSLKTAKALQTKAETEKKPTETIVGEFIERYLLEEEKKQSRTVPISPMSGSLHVPSVMSIDKARGKTRDRTSAQWRGQNDS